MKLDSSYDGDFPDSFSWKESEAGKTWVGGTIAHIGEPFERDDQYKADVTQEVFPIILDGDTDSFTLWVTSKKDIVRNPRPDRKYQAIAEAIAVAGAEELLEGATLNIKHESNKDTGKGNPEKLYKATYTPPVKGMAMPVAADAELAPF